MVEPRPPWCHTDGTQWGWLFGVCFGACGTLTNQALTCLGRTGLHYLPRSSDPWHILSTLEYKWHVHPILGQASTASANTPHMGFATEDTTGVVRAFVYWQSNCLGRESWAALISTTGPCDLSFSPRLFPTFRAPAVLPPLVGRDLLSHDVSATLSPQTSFQDIVSTAIAPGHFAPPVWVQDNRFHREELHCLVAEVHCY